MIGTSTKAAGLFGAALLAVAGQGVGCTPPPPALKCVALPSTALPLQHANEVLTVRTAPGANVLTVARYRTVSVSKVGTANSLGIAKVTYNIGSATIGYPIHVAALVAKGTQRGSCSTSFTPTRAASFKPPTKPVQPPTKPVQPTGPQTLSCPEVVFPPDINRSENIPLHSFNIQAIGTDCTEAHALAEAASQSGPRGGFPFELDGFSCSGGGSQKCSNPGSGAVVTFNYGTVDGTGCGSNITLPSAAGTINNLEAVRTLCSTAVAVAHAGLGYQAGTPGFSAETFTCRTYYSSAPYLYNCLSPDKLEWIGFQLA